MTDPAPPREKRLFLPRKNPLATHTIDSADLRALSSKAPISDVHVGDHAASGIGLLFQFVEAAQQSVDEVLARDDLIQRDELVGAVGVANVSGPAHHWASGYIEKN